MKKILKIIVLIVFSSGAFADDPYEVWPEEVAASEKLKQALRANDRKAVAAMIAYPMARQNPLLEIRDKKEFLANWDDYFDAQTTAEVLAAKPQDFGWRGMALGDGDVWFINNKITAINIRTKHYAKTYEAAVAEDNSELNPIARGYKYLSFACDTGDLHLRIHEYGGKDQRLYAWSDKHNLSETPKLELKKSGIWEFQGSGGNLTHQFTDGALRYEIEETRLCGEDCNHYFVTYRDNREVGREKCDEKSR